MTAADEAAPPPADGRRRPVAFLGVAVVLLGAMVGGNLFGLRDRLTGQSEPLARPVAVSRQAGQIPSSTAASSQSVLRSYPWWQTLVMVHGSGAPVQAPSFTVDGGALQWRIVWSCTSGRLAVGTKTVSAVVDTPCPDSGTTYRSETGPTTLAIAAGAAWTIEVDQQVDVPLVEPPTPEMGAPGTQIVASGSLYGVDQSGSGQATFFRLSDGTFALRLDKFFITPNVDLEIRLSPLAAPHSTSQYLAAPSVSVAPLDVTTGSINFSVPATVNPLSYRTLAIWCPTISSLYAAATLGRAP